MQNMYVPAAVLIDRAKGGQQPFTESKGSQGEGNHKIKHTEYKSLLGVLPIHPRLLPLFKQQTRLSASELAHMIVTGINNGDLGDETIEGKAARLDRLANLLSWLWVVANGGFQDVGTEEAPVKSANFTQSLLAKKNLRPGFAPKRTARAPTAEDGNEVQPQQRVKKRREERRQPNRRKKQRRNNPSASDEFQLDQAILNRAARHSQWKEWQRGWPKAAPSPGATPVDLCRSFQMKGFCNGNCSFAHKPTDQLRKEDFQAISQKVQLARQLGAA